MKSILLIDTLGNAADSTEEMLERYGFYVELAETEISVQRRIKASQFDLILIELPRQVGHRSSQRVESEQIIEDLGKSTGLIRSLRAWRVTSPIIVYTILKGDLYETAALDAGADDYILKSQDCSVLLAHLHAHLRRSQRDLGVAAGEDRRTSVGRFVIDRQTRILFSEQRPVQLTTNEVALLERLAANPYRVVSVSEILDYVWGEGLGRSHKALEGLVKRLRRKMEKNGLGNPIETARGLGFKLSPTLLPMSDSSIDRWNKLGNSRPAVIDTNHNA